MKILFFYLLKRSSFCNIHLKNWLMPEDVEQCWSQQHHVQDLSSHIVGESWYSVRRSIRSFWANKKVITKTKWSNQPTFFVYCLGIMGPEISDYDKRLILLSVIRLSGGHYIIFLFTRWHHPLVLFQDIRIAASGVNFTNTLVQSPNVSVYGTKDAIQFHRQDCT